MDDGRPGREFAVASLIVGIGSFVHVMNLEKGILAVVFGVLAMRRLAGQPSRAAILGIALGVINVIAVVVMTIALWPQMMHMMQKTGS